MSDWHERRRQAMTVIEQERQEQREPRRRVAALAVQLDQLAGQARYFNESGRTKPAALGESMAAIAEERRRLQNRIDESEQRVQTAAGELAQLHAETMPQEG